MPEPKIRPAAFFSAPFLICAAVLLASGCATLFGWDIHAPGVLSNRFYSRVLPQEQRIGLYLDPSLHGMISTDRGGRFADPQTYHIGEAYVPMAIEAFQQGFTEFVLIESEPTQEMLRQYAIPYLVYIKPGDFGNDVTLKGQAVSFETEVFVFDRNLGFVDRFTTTGSSDAKKVFAKKGGPQVNLNAALENNAESIALHIQDALRSGRWVKNVSKTE
ncbi:MAG: hypothetical protein BWY42_00087 [Candidatus Omnitrophica bacterium ADurb.Bin277]|nr:MAG: hypothetical protein BWY42_00087 [Candidatus Omnitrophica bacterium ADurb.Bin277]